MAPILSTMKVNQNYSTQQLNKQQLPNFTAGNSEQSNNNSLADKIIQNNALLNVATTPPEKPGSFAAQAVASVLAMFGINKVLNIPLINQEYKDTLFKKIENYGDNIGNIDVVKKAGNVLSSAKRKASSIVDKSEILRTLFRKESLGGSMAMTQAMSVKQHLASYAVDTIKVYNAQHPNAVFKNLIKKIGDDKETYKYYDEIFDAIRRSGADLKKIVVDKSPWTFGLLNRKTSLQELLNKKILVDNYNNGKTLGQKLSGYFMRGSESITNGFFGGKGAMLIHAIFIAQSLNEASKAEKGEKFQTFMASLLELMAYVATAGVQLRVVNHLAGLKYMGMSPENVKKYKEAVRLANEAVKNKNFSVYADQIRNARNLKLLASKSVKWYQKPLKWIGDIASLGRIRETIKPLKSNMVSQALSKVWYGLKVGTGWVGRIAFIMAVLMPLFAGTAKKISYAIFGKPTKTIEREKQKEQEEELKAKQAEKAERLKRETEQTVSNQNQNVQSANTPEQPAKPGNLLDTMRKQGVTPSASTPLNQPVQGVDAGIQRTYIPNPILGPENAPIASTPVSPDAGIKRSYIPNPVLGEEKSAILSETRSAEIDRVMRQADWAEAQANKYL